jgi:hypothetical protein
MFWRVVHLGAIASIVGSAVYAYTIKYETIWQGEQLAKTRRQIAKERDDIAALKAEWARLSRPERMQSLSAGLTDLQPMTLEQIARVSELPERTVRYDAIGRKLELLGLSEPTATPSEPVTGDDMTPTASLPASPPTPPVAPRR